jgi:hypothetical protein
MAVETVTLRKGSARQRYALDGTVVLHTRIRGGTSTRVSRRSWANGVMARAKRDLAVAELVAAGWAVEGAVALRKPSKEAAVRLPLTRIAVVGRVSRVTDAELAGLALPKGHASFLAKFGPGELAGLRVLALAHIARETKAWRKALAKLAPLFVNLREHVTEETQARLVVLARSLDGDVVASDGVALWIFPRGSDRVHAMGTTFEEALGWWCYAEAIGERRCAPRAKVPYRAG